jgi:hypothetical protein
VLREHRKIAPPLGEVFLGVEFRRIGSLGHRRSDRNIFALSSHRIFSFNSENVASQKSRYVLHLDRCGCTRGSHSRGGCGERLREGQPPSRTGPETLLKKSSSALLIETSESLRCRWPHRSAGDFAFSGPTESRRKALSQLVPPYMGSFFLPLGRERHFVKIGGPIRSGSAGRRSPNVPTLWGLNSYSCRWIA